MATKSVVEAVVPAVESPVPAITALEQDLHNLTERCAKAFKTLAERATLDRSAVVALTTRVAALESANKALRTQISGISLKLDNVGQESRRERFIQALNDLRDEAGMPGASFPEAQVIARMKLNAALSGEQAAPMAVAPEEEVF